MCTMQYEQPTYSPYFQNSELLRDIIHSNSIKLPNFQICLKFNVGIWICFSELPNRSFYLGCPDCYICHNYTIFICQPLRPLEPELARLISIQVNSLVQRLINDSVWLISAIKDADGLTLKSGVHLQGHQLIWQLIRQRDQDNMIIS